MGVTGVANADVRQEISVVSDDTAKMNWLLARLAAFVDEGEDHTCTHTRTHTHFSFVPASAFLFSALCSVFWHAHTHTEEKHLGHEGRREHAYVCVCVCVGEVIIFASQRAKVESLVTELTKAGARAGAIHGDLDQVRHTYTYTHTHTLIARCVKECHGPYTETQSK